MAYEIEPLGTRVVCEVRVMPERTASGLYIPTTVREEHHAAEADVLAVGPDVKGLAVGDHIIFNEFTGAEVELDGQRVKIMREEDVLAKVTEKKV